ncbi:hypothetical protein QAD02_017027 [Eretmocerus hayati]|uniref:Uncharacterized protein n=1 Tax=Eretmocerus hayati TaxID=131215 RepID=A0ACC2PHK0_9HYME|nr:hypothetical protein QAD02_017027 [Eretmocerus hayati]
MPPSDEVMYTTGNILLLNELTKKAGLNSRDELIEALKILEDSKKKGDFLNINNAVDTNAEDVDRKEMKITVKIFLSHSDPKYLQEAIDEVCKGLHTDKLESLVIVLNKQQNTDDILNPLQELWSVLEEYHRDGKLMSVGVSDIDTEKFIELFNWAKIKPNIIQINLATCCVVPPALQEFTKQNDIQLLTHSDPSPLLTDEPVTDFFGKDAKLKWVARYQVHLKCRGVLSAKGYFVQINRS